MNRIDLNSDMGELPESISDGTQEALMSSLTSINIACGGHAGDENTMRATFEQARRSKVAVGAHPGYPDIANFGRVGLDLPLESVATFVFEQVRTLARLASAFGVEVVHVKPHGALYNQAARDPQLAEAIAAGVGRWSRHVVLVGLAGSVMLDVFKDAGFPVGAEAFADRRYEPDGNLRSRRFEDALITDPKVAAAQAIGIAIDSRITTYDGTAITVKAQTVCVHSDTPRAVEIASFVAESLSKAGVILSALSCPMP